MVGAEHTVTPDPSAGITIVTEPLIAPGTIEKDAIKGTKTGQGVKSEATIANITLSFENLGEYMVKLAGAIITNIDEIDEKFLTPALERGGYDSRLDLLITCGEMAGVGSMFMKSGVDIVKSFQPPKFIDVEIIDGKTTIKRINWKGEFCDLMHDIENDRSDDFDDMTAPGASEAVSRFYSFYEMHFGGGGENYDPEHEFLPKEVSLMVDPLSSMFQYYRAP